MTECLKQLSGNCVGCPILDRMVRWVELGAKYQEVVPFISKTDCPPNVSPTVEVHFSPKSGAISGLLIAGQEVKLGG